MMCLLFLPGRGNAQDTLLFLNQKMIPVHIQKQHRFVLWYIIAGDTAEVIHKVNKRMIRELRYANGVTMKVSGAPLAGTTFRERNQVRLNRPPFQEGNNLVGTGIKSFGLRSTITAIYVDYEQRFLHNLAGLGIAPHIGINRESVGAAVSLFYTVAPHLPVNFRVGPVLLMWTEKETFLNRTSTVGQPFIQKYIQERTFRGGVMAKVEFKLNTGKKLSLSPGFAVGRPIWGNEAFIFRDGENYYRQAPFRDILWQWQLGAGYRF
ncbi:hypothetical protein LQ567_13720 [Niabella pedocola]|uniref:Outer membrane protein beta-barrel domain-containing protein n=1 Tax=Niabella pedocola TaxID=1752077 RepID=A0ABS8PSP4_9BACT|nr:hypothetical protein [Niabella pedocola]MCD2423829.1 hypothetical protein [Niabella pedocola]